MSARTNGSQAPARVVLDTPGLSATPAWARAVFEALELTPVSNDAVAGWLADDPQARTALLQTNDPVTEAEALAPHYARALRALHGTSARLGLWGTAWLVHGRPVTACVIDWSQVKALARTDATGAEALPARHFEHESREFVEGRVARALQPDRVCVLHEGDATTKAAEALGFLRALR